MQQCVGIQKVKEEAVRELQFSQLKSVAYERAVEKMRAVLFRCLMSAHGVHVPAWLR